MRIQMYDILESLECREPRPVPKKQTQEGSGEAYSFFSCGASKQEIEEELPFIREVVKTPNQLEIFLFRMAELEADEEPNAFIQRVRAEELNYGLIARCLSATNRETANEVAAILSQSYQSPLYANGESFKGFIVYEKNGEYVERE